MPQRRPRVAVVGLIVATALAGVAVAGSAAALAEFASGTPAESHAVSTAVLQPPTSPAVAHGSCTPAVRSSVVVSWTPTSSTWADGYVLSRATALSGPYTDIATVSGRATSSYVNTPLPFSTTFHYRVRATKQAWRSANTATVSITTKSLLCL